MTSDGRPAAGPRAEVLRAEILQLVRQYHDAAFPRLPFAPGESPVPTSGRVFDASELEHLVDASLDFWLTTGRFAAQFERAIAQWTGARHALLVNSGSSANLLALACLTSPKLGDRALRPGDEVITAATGFPTTVNPILQYQLVPVFVDMHVPTYNLDVSLLEQARSGRTRAIMLAHTLGNPVDLAAITAFARRHDLWLIEDCCDALGARYAGQHVGTFGDLGTVSFYPAHQITMGEGGCVLTSTPLLKTLVESFRDWGRDCWCDPGKDNTCGKRFGWQLGDLPAGYDHKYTYAHIGYNLKATDLQASIGVAQLDKLPAFVERRLANWRRLRAGLADLEDVLILPEATADSEPSWFGFLISVRADAPFSRDQLTAFLEARRISTRLLFGGNLVRQPAYLGRTMRTVGALTQADFIMRQSFWIGVYPGLSEDAIAYVIDTLHAAVTTLR